MYVEQKEKRTSQVYFADYDYICLDSYVTSLTVTTYQRKKGKMTDYTRMINCLTPDIHNPMSSVCDPRVRSSTWRARAAGRSRASIAIYLPPKSEFIRLTKFYHEPRVSTISWSTTGLDRVSQFKASKRGLILRSRSSASRFWLACYKRTISIVYNSKTNKGTNGDSLPHPIKML